jgi:hypothetical protein
MDDDTLSFMVLMKERHADRSSHAWHAIQKFASAPILHSFYTLLFKVSPVLILTVKVRRADSEPHSITIKQKTRSMWLIKTIAATRSIERSDAICIQLMIACFLAIWWPLCTSMFGSWSKSTLAAHRPTSPTSRCVAIVTCGCLWWQMLSRIP